MRFPLCLLLASLPLLGQSGFSLPGGLRVKLIENHERALVEARVEVAWPAEDERGLEGASTLLGAVLETGGAGPFNAAAWRKALDEQGISLRFEARPGRFVWTLQCPSSAQEAAFAFLAHALARPLLDGPAVELQRARLYREGQLRSPVEAAEERFRWALLEGRPEGLLEEGKLVHLSLEQLQIFQSRVLRPERATLALLGDLNLAQARQLAQLHLGIWGPTALPRPAGPPLPPAPPVLALPQGRPEARLALLAPEGDGAVKPLSRLLERWIQGAAPAGCEGQLIATGRGPCLLLRAQGGPGDDALKLLETLRGWAAALASRRVGPEETAIARRLQASLAAASALHPARQIEEAFLVEASPSDAAALQTCLARWFAPERMRVLLLGCPAPPKEAPALKDLGALVWLRPVENRATGSK